jgi:very-short-patch-repair endonuclease
MSDFGKGGELLNLESVQRAISESALYLGNEMARRHRDGIRFAVAYMNRARPMESPLEAIFYGWFSAIAELENQEIYTFPLIPQARVELGEKSYRFDFQVLFGPQAFSDLAMLRRIEAPKVAIELDGHDFHERTKEQVAYRNERDRDVTAAGWTILHFSGSELYKDPLKCASDVLAICKQKHDAFSYAVYQSTNVSLETK